MAESRASNGEFIEDFPRAEENPETSTPTNEKPFEETKQEEKAIDVKEKDDFGNEGFEDVISDEGELMKIQEMVRESVGDCQARSSLADEEGFCREDVPNFQPENSHFRPSAALAFKDFKSQFPNDEIIEKKSESRIELDLELQKRKTKKSKLGLSQEPEPEVEHINETPRVTKKFSEDRNKESKPALESCIDSAQKSDSNFQSTNPFRETKTLMAILSAGVTNDSSQKDSNRSQKLENSTGAKTHSSTKADGYLNKNAFSTGKTKPEARKLDLTPQKTREDMKARLAKPWVPSGYSHPIGKLPQSSSKGFNSVRADKETQQGRTHDSERAHSPVSGNNTARTKNQGSSKTPAKTGKKVCLPVDVADEKQMRENNFRATTRLGIEDIKIEEEEEDNGKRKKNKRLHDLTSKKKMYADTLKQKLKKDLELLLF